MEPPDVQYIDGVPVTRADIRLWLLTIPKLSPDGAYARYYTTAWDVPNKIARQKKLKAWPPINPETTDPEGEMLILYSRGRVDTVLNLATGEHMSLKEAVKRAAAGQLSVPDAPTPDAADASAARLSLRRRLRPQPSKPKP